MKKLFKEKKAITVIALATTVIILLILAGVSINMIFGNEGIFSKTKIAVEKYQNAQKVEEIDIAKISNEIDTIINRDKNTATISDYRENLICEFKNLKTENNLLISDTNSNITAGTIDNSITIKSENKIRYISFDGTKYIKTDEFTELSGNSAKTILCWFRADQRSGMNNFIALGNWATAKGGICPHLNNGYARFDTGYNNYVYTPNTLFFADKKWHFACVTFNENTIVFYIDNEVLFATNATLNTVSPYLIIGGAVDCTFKGDISDIRVYNKGLNVEEVYRVYKSTMKI